MTAYNPAEDKARALSKLTEQYFDGDTKAMNRWAVARNPQLDDQTPLAVLQKEGGHHEVLVAAALTLKPAAQPV